MKKIRLIVLIIFIIGIIVFAKCKRNNDVNVKDNVNNINVPNDTIVVDFNKENNESLDVIDISDM